MTANCNLGKHDWKQDSKGNWGCYEKKEECDYWCKKDKCEKDGELPIPASDRSEATALVALS